MDDVGERLSQLAMSAGHAIRNDFDDREKVLKLFVKKVQDIVKAD